MATIIITFFSLEMHRIFQQELWRMRLNVARTTVDTLQSADTSVALANAAPVKLAAQVDNRYISNLINTYLTYFEFYNKLVSILH